MNPSDKSPGMEQAITDIFGFDRRAQIKANLCCPPPIGCGGEATEFNDELSRKEYSISGLCQKCQDKIFEGGDDDEQLSTIATPPVPPDYIPGPNDWVAEAYSMFSGQSEAASHRYHQRVGKSGRIWLWADNETPAENVYVANNPSNTTSHRQGSEGFGGSTLTFELVGGGTLDLHGPWHSGAEGLFTDTGVDLRNTYRTFTVLGMGREFIGSVYNRRTVITDVIYKDPTPIIGPYDRYKEIMAQFPQARFYHHSSKGGSSCGMTDLEHARYRAARDVK